MRFFVGITLSEELKANIATWQQEHSVLPLRWTKPENLHITLIPPWDEDDIDTVTRKLEKILLFQFKVTFNTISFGPPHNYRLIWAAGEMPEEFVELQEKLYAALESQPEKKRSILHATIARFKPESLSSFPIKKLDEEVEWGMEVKSFSLFRSYLSNKGAEYEIVKTIGLS